MAASAKNALHTFDNASVLHFVVKETLRCDHPILFPAKETVVTGSIDGPHILSGVIFFFPISFHTAWH